MKAATAESKAKKLSAVEPKKLVTVQAPQLRTAEAMKHDLRRKPPVSDEFEEKEPERNGARARVRAGRKKRVKSFLPTTLSSAKYAEHKAKALAKGATAKRKTELTKGLSAAVLDEALSPVISTGDIEGATDVDGLIPPDTHGAIGSDEFVEVTNSHIDIFPRNDPANRTSLSLAAFFGYFNQTLFDPRVVYDSTWNRWIVTADAFPDPKLDNIQSYFIAVSLTPSAAGPFFIYQLNVTFNQGDFWDYPQLGIDQDSVIITANIFGAQGDFKGADMFAVAKARLYNGLGFSVPVFVGLEATLAPPIVLDQNPNTFLVAAPGGNVLALYTLQNSSNAGIALFGPVEVLVDPYAAPGPAAQPGTSATLDTLDGRFVNASTQVGNSLWQVHTIDLGGLPTPKYYQIDTSANAILRTGTFFASQSSYDFNASVAANSDNDVFFTWTSIDPNAGINAQVRFAGIDHNDNSEPGAGLDLFTSSTFFTGGRWGDYSAVTVDPLNSREAWFVNEDVVPNGDWGSRIGSVGFP
ncbi:hypothetical protein HYR54_13690 [Candidatus Acetothermia bacterium]|nr:hypothetical protein [Candidatus Acetothermia bacterium]MBI3661186.1 hypothetical protein [Candidatus Acetothermia bacterium]